AGGRRVEGHRRRPAVRGGGGVGQVHRLPRPVRPALPQPRARGHGDDGERRRGLTLTWSDVMVATCPRRTSDPTATASGPAGRPVRTAAALVVGPGRCSPACSGRRPGCTTGVSGGCWAAGSSASPTSGGGQGGRTGRFWR